MRGRLLLAAALGLLPACENNPSTGGKTGTGGDSGSGGMMPGTGGGPGLGGAGGNTWRETGGNTGDTGGIVGQPGGAGGRAGGAMATGGNAAGAAGTSAVGAGGIGGQATGGVIGRDGGRPEAGRESGAEVSDVAAAGSDGKGTEAGSGVCDNSDPPANVAAWINESWDKEGKNNITSRKNWLADSAMVGKGQINICVRYGATKPVSTATRDLVAPAMQRWFNKWFAVLYPYDCFPYSQVTVKVTGWAVKPGQESVLGWTDRTVPVYTEVSDGSDQAKGEPKCPDACGFFFHQDHVFSKCAGGEDNHFDYTLWLDDTLPSGNAAEGSDWGVRMPVASFLDNINADNYTVMLHEIGHGFAISDYYTWTGSKPTGGSVMIIGSSNGLTVGDQWMVRRYWKETRALRYSL